MIRILCAAVLALAIAGCATVMPAPSKTQVYIGAQGFDAIEATATVYANLPRCGVQPCSSVAVLTQLKPIIKAGRSARTNLENWVKANPTGITPPQLVSALATAVSAAKAIFSKNGITP